MRNARSDRWSVIAKLKRNISAPCVEERQDAVPPLFTSNAQRPAALPHMFVYLVSTPTATARVALCDSRFNIRRKSTK